MMRLRQVTTVFLLGITSLLAACGSNGLSEGKAKDAIEQALSGSMLCYPWPSASPETAILFDKETDFLAQIAKNGWVNVTAEAAQNVNKGHGTWFFLPQDGYIVAHDASINLKANVYVVRLTDKGRALHKPAAMEPESGLGSPGLCSGQKTVTDIKRFSEPATDVEGKIVSEVVFRYGFDGLAPEFTELMNEAKNKLPAGQEQVGTIRLFKTNNGWSPEGTIHYAIEKEKT